jgi:hypothetical protein
MTQSIAIYLEGGGDTTQTLTPFRNAMSSFLKPAVDAARKKRVQWRMIACGGRQQAYEAYKDALKKEPEVHNILLVDSEDPVAISVSPWEHVKNRIGDQWEKPPQVDDAQLQMMVACMEAWFLADINGLKKHYGGNFDAEKLPKADQAENQTKAKINDALKKATQNTTAKEYRKIRDGVKLLTTIDSAVVRRNCKWCERLFIELEKVLGTMV